MANFSKKEREYYNKRRDLASKSLGLNKNQYNALRRVSQGLSKADTNSANGTTGGNPIYHGNKIVNEYSEKHYNKDVAKHFSKAEALRKKLGGKNKLHFYHQTDPRGVALYASKKRMDPSRYNSEGHAIH